MSERKNVLDLRSNKEGISTLESNEQQRNWTKDHYNQKVSDSLSNYDPTREHLNFEVTRGGIVQPIDKSKTIDQKMRKNLASRGIKNPNDRQDLKCKRRILAQFILSGNTERMREIAFGNQKVGYKKGADNSSITRSKDIEQWAKDEYNFIAKKFGEENIVSCYVHLDETAPHMHLTLLPVKDNKISYRALFGNSMREESQTLTKLHTESADEVGKKWGLERGSNMTETKAKHRSTQEYKRELVKQVIKLEGDIEDLRKLLRNEERKLKSFTTMLKNLQEQRSDVMAEIDKIAKQFDLDGVTTSEVAEKMKDLRHELEGIDRKIAFKQEQLEQANAYKKELEEKIDSLQESHAYWQSLKDDDISLQATIAEHEIYRNYISMLNEGFQPAKSTLSYEQKCLLEESDFTELTEHKDDVLYCALRLAFGLVDEVTRYTNSSGGGSNNLSGWGRKKDEDDDEWWRRCIRTSASLMKSARRMGRHR